MQSESEIAEMGVEDQNDREQSKVSATGCISRSNGDTPAKNLVQSNDSSSTGDVQMAKVRKPYTITKQREKWTEEEHQKFLEALKLYGRGWRQIEEHVGTKTAVQIRSHAQKFFSKLVRESSGAAENPVESIEIPPPRPKRKPLHPYPRKLADCYQGNSIMAELEKSPSPKLQVTEKITCSPMSVLTANGSDAFGSASSEQTNRCLSPNCCTTEIQSVGKFPVAKENDNMTSNSSEEEKDSLPFVPESFETNLKNLVSLKFEPLCEENDSSKGTSTATQTSTIKLFGRTVSIPDNEKPLVADMEVRNSISRVQNEGSGVFDEERIGLSLASNDLSTQLSLSLPHCNSNSPRGVADLNSMENEQELLRNVDSANDASLPWLTFCQGLPTRHSTNNKILVPKPVYACVRERSDCKEAVKESSCTGSNSSISSSEVDNVDKKLDVTDCQNQGPLIEAPKSGMSSCRYSSRGFVPYKRCLAERNADSAVSAMEERSAQRARVCS